MNSKDPAIQGLMDDVDQIDSSDPDLETKLQLIAEKVAAARQKTSGNRAVVDESQITDPGDAFACEGCQ